MFSTALFSKHLRIIPFVLLPFAIHAANVKGHYILELSTEPVVDLVSPRVAQGARTRPVVRLADLNTSRAHAHRARLHAEQDLLRPTLEGRGAKVLERVDTVANALIVQAPDTVTEADLAAMPGVKHVYPVRSFKMVLDRAVLTHRIVEAWNQVGGSDRAGEGMKIAILDSGIDVSHAGFQDPSVTAPPGFPRVNRSADTINTNNKVVVARSYVDLLPSPDSDYSAADHVGHGTALGMVAAGMRNVGPYATITGVAPKAWLGNYKVFGTPGDNESTTTSVILKAIDDAVADGMDVINLSLGSDLAPRLGDDIEVQGVERAVRAGVLVVIAAGNGGNDLNTVSSPGTAPSAITVGAITNDRVFGGSVALDGAGTFDALLGNTVTTSATISATIVDIASLDSTGQACDTLPGSSLTGKIALIVRGACTFESKLNNAQAAGAVAAIVYAAADSPDAFVMSLGAATLPAEMVTNQAGTSLKQAIASGSADGTISFARRGIPVAGNLLASFTGSGPNVDFGIKPDLVAVGTYVYMATQTLDKAGDMYDASGYVLADGTSFATPIVAGAAALIKAARPGLTMEQYRSLLIDSAFPLSGKDGTPLRMQQSGAGMLDVAAALRSTVTASPASFSFGAGGGTQQSSRVLTLTNVGTSNETFAITPVSRAGGLTPELSRNNVQLAAGESTSVGVSWNANGLTAGAYEGFLTVTAASTGNQVNVPYWYAVPSSVAARIKIFEPPTSGRRGGLLRRALQFKVTDASGVAITNASVKLSAVSGGGTTSNLASFDSEVPGLYRADVRLGTAAGTNVFRVQVDDAFAEVSITGR